MVLVPSLVTRVTSLEKELKETKQILGNAMVKLVKKVKYLETALKRKSKKRIHENEREVNRFCYSYKPTILEAAKTLSKDASQGVSKVKSTGKGKRYRRRARSVAKNINTRLDAEEEINTGIEEVSTGSAKFDSGTASKRGQREGKAPMVEEDIHATHKTKEQIRQEEAGLEEAIKLQAQMDEEVSKQIHLDELIAKRMAEEEALSEQQKKRKDVLGNAECRVVKRCVGKGSIGEKVAKVKEKEPVKRTGKRKKQKARKGISVDKNAQGDSEADKEELVEAMNPTPLATKSNIVKYGTNRPEDAYDKVLWSDLRTMFDLPLNEDAIWSLPL
ncbi:hypothetical protein Tco_1371976 [Tanacetum coccineum]